MNKFYIKQTCDSTKLKKMESKQLHFMIMCSGLVRLQFLKDNRKFYFSKKQACKEMQGEKAENNFQFGTY